MANVIAELVGRIGTLLGYDGDAFRNVTVDATGHLQIDTLSSALPAGAATGAKQDDIRNALEVIDNLCGALWSVNTDALVVKVESSDLPNGAATEAKQTSMITILELIQELRGALHSINTDELQVRGEDQVFSFKGPLVLLATGAVSGTNGYINSEAVPAGEIWVVTTVAARDATTSVTRIFISNNHNGVGGIFYSEDKVWAVGEFSYWSGHTYLDVGDFVQAFFLGSLPGDTCRLIITGYRMTVEA